MVKRSISSSQLVCAVDVWTPRIFAHSILGGVYESVWLCHGIRVACVPLVGIRDSHLWRSVHGSWSSPAWTVVVETISDLADTDWERWRIGGGARRFRA